MSVTLAGLKLEHPIMLGAGVCKTAESVLKVGRSSVAGVVKGSGTVLPRPGNTGNVYDANKVCSINSLGLPNPGKEYDEKHLPDLVSQLHDLGKVLFYSAAGFSPEEYAVLTEMALAAGVDAVEENFGCPNLWGMTGQKPIVSFVPDLVADILDLLERRVGKSARVGAKVSPYSDPFGLVATAKPIAKSELIKFVTTTNSFPNAYLLDESGKPWITPGEGLAGMAGPALKAIGLGQVKQWRKLLPERIQLIGVGGVSCGQDVLDYIRAGATGVQVVTAYLESGEDPRFFDKLLTEYLAILESLAV